MGWRISWLAIKKQERTAILTSFGLHSTDEPNGRPKGMISGTTLPNGFFLLFLNDTFHPFVEPEALSVASLGCEIVGCQVEEGIMASSSFCWRDGKQVWNVIHDAEKGVRNLLVEGNPPEVISDLMTRAHRLQNKERKFPFLSMPWEVDHFFRVPIDLSASVVGFEHDRAEYSWGQPVFEPLAVGMLS